VDVKQTKLAAMARRMAARSATRAALVVFDCDSTLTAVEGIDELAAGHRAAVAALTDAAMRGELPLEAVYGRRLELIRPGRAQLDALARRYIEELVPDAAAVVATLRGAGVIVRVMSGGLLPAVQALGTVLGLDAADVAAVDIRFDAAGAYAGFDAASPLARSGGKRELLQLWRDRLGPDAGAVIMVGDGATDLEAADVADVFVAYAGVVERPAVVATADVVVRSASLAPILPLALGTDAVVAPAARALLERGIELLQHDHE
jgi:phosphoserine phosphatase